MKPIKTATEVLFREVIPSPLGRLTLIASERGLRSISFGGAAGGKPCGQTHVAAARRQLEEYFAGRRRQFALDLDWRGTLFEQRVWTQLLAIPYGETRSYAGIARGLGQPTACRAVGGANGRNPLPIVVPCHRVIAADGSLGGYSGRGGLATKARLLRLENGAGEKSLAPGAEMNEHVFN